MDIKIHTNIDEIPRDQWNALVRDNNPLVSHEFLAAMEHHGCVGEAFGWLPCHIAIYEGGRLVASMPMYEKHNSYGEFVFDHQWEHAWNRSGLAYFPKLVSAVPYTPATGQRMLVKDGEMQYCNLLAKTAVELGKHAGASGVHILFPLAEQQKILEQDGWMSRHDVQFHWRNRGYINFDDFLDRLTARKRKAIRRERRIVEESDVTIRQLDGKRADRDDWEAFAGFYDKTFEEKWGMATFNLGFFEEVARNLPEQVLLVLAEMDGEPIAGALMYRSDNHLYGRHWGCSRQVDMLHFEVCYYQGIEYAIANNLDVFEPGAQGEHKIARGFLPTLTTSAHQVFEEGFRQPLTDWTAHERSGVAAYLESLESRSPYRKEDLT